MAEMEQGYIDSLIEKAQKAQKEFESYSQEQVDAIVKAMGKIIYDNAELTKKITNVIRCKNPRCITSIEQGLDQVFFLADEEKEIYRCQYCEEKYRHSSKK